MEGIVRGIIKLNPLTEIIFLISVSIISFANNSLKLDFFYSFNCCYYSVIYGTC